MERVSEGEAGAQQFARVVMVNELLEEPQRFEALATAPPQHESAHAIAAPAIAEAVIEEVALEAPVEASPKARAVGGERTLAMLLRAGGILGGACFLASLPLQWMPDGERVHVAIDLLRKAGASFLIVTPVARMGVAGVLLGMKGETRYLLYAVASVGLLVAALGAGAGA